MRVTAIPVRYHCLSTKILDAKKCQKMSAIILIEAEVVSCFKTVNISNKVYTKSIQRIKLETIGKMILHKVGLKMP